MFFFPFTILIFLLFILFLPVLFLLGYFHIIVLGFENLGISPGGTLLILFLILTGSLFNIPLTRKKLVLVQKPYFFGLFSRPKVESHYLAVNLGGAVIPTLLSFYFLFLAKNQGFDLTPILIATLLMVFVSKSFSRLIPGKGIVLPGFIPPLFSALFSVILAPSFSAPCAFISGVLGTLIGADILNLPKLKDYPGFLSIGGAGVFDGIFLVGIMSALLSGI
jgi:uncharacterized membrane protein